MNAPEEDDSSLEDSGWAGAITLLLFFSPLIAFLGAMRWHIPGKLDRDLEFIFYWVVDAFLYFLVAYPFFVTAKNKRLKEVLGHLSAGAFTVFFVAKVLAVVAFVLATFFAFHYLIGELFDWLL